MTYVGLVLLESEELNYQQLCITIAMMAFTMYCTSLWLDNKKGYLAETIRISLCLLIYLVTYQESVMTQISSGLLIYSILNLGVLPFINRAKI